MPRERVNVHTAIAENLSAAIVRQTRQRKQNTQFLWNCNSPALCQAARAICFEEQMNAHTRLQVGRITIHPEQVTTIVERFFAHEATFYLTDENYKLAGEHAQWTLFHVAHPSLSNSLRNSLPGEHFITITAKHIPNERETDKPNVGDYPDRTIGKVFISPVQADTFVEIEKWIFEDAYLDALWDGLLARLRKVTGKEDAAQQTALKELSASRGKNRKGRRPEYDSETMCLAVMEWRELQAQPRRASDLDFDDMLDDAPAKRMTKIEFLANKFNGGDVNNLAVSERKLDRWAEQFDKGAWEIPKEHKKRYEKLKSYKKELWRAITLK